MKLIKTADNTETFLNEEVGESYHSQTGAVEEAVKKYAVPCKIKELAKSGEIKILDICSGILYNSAAAIDTALEENPNCKIEIIALEFDPEIVEKIQEIDPPFRCYDLIKKITKDNLEVKEGNVSIKVILGDARKTIKDLSEDYYDAVFMDPFSPKTAPEMWEVFFFKDIYRVIKEDKIMATYTCARMARDNMKEAGFSYDNGPIVGRRGPGTIAWKEEFFKLRNFLFCMKIGYPCINTSIGCTSNRTFRLRNYSEERMIEIIDSNLSCLKIILDFNKKHNLLFFRISSDIIPFASHPICKFNWRKYFKKQFLEIGDFIKKHKIRISMHPDQFTLINAKDPEIVKRSIAELKYHCEVLDALGLDTTAKVQIHVGGVYEDKEASIKRFVSNYKRLPIKIKRRLVIENDHISYSSQDCLEIHKQTGIPLILDSFHHECKNNGESFLEAIKMVKKTWKKEDGIPMVDYSSQEKGKRVGTHARTIDLKHFRRFLKETKGYDFDIMLEIKDKEKSALKAVKR